jgi:hypothetical protein
MKEASPTLVIILIGNEENEKNISLANLIFLDMVHLDLTILLFGLENGKKYGLNPSFNTSIIDEVFLGSILFNVSTISRSARNASAPPGG